MSCARAAMARRSGAKGAVEVLVFLRSCASGKLKECSRCYAGDWGFYFNHLRIDGQRIGMYFKSVDCWITENSLKSVID